MLDSKGRFLKGHKLSEETKRKMSEAHKKRKTYLQLLPFNKNPSDAVREGRRKRMLGNKYVLGKKWSEKEYERHYHDCSSLRYRKWRESVFMRDDYTCCDCGERGVYIEAHHIKSWVDFPDERYNVDNGQTLCVRCHKEKR
jgi:5-methylcytosine-specific restriction endonuclease McrA